MCISVSRILPYSSHPMVCLLLTSPFYPREGHQVFIWIKTKWSVLNHSLLLIRFSVYSTPECLGLLFLHWVHLLVLVKTVDVLADLEAVGAALVSALISMALGIAVPEMLIESFITLDSAAGSETARRLIPRPITLEPR